MGELNWTIEVVIGFLSLIPCGTSLFDSIINTPKNPSTHYYYFIGTWGCVFLWCFFASIAHLFLSIAFLMIASLAFTGVAFFSILVLDFIAREAVDIWKLLLLTSLTVANAFLAFGYQSFYIESYPNGVKHVDFGGYFEISSAATMFFVGLVWAFYAIRLNQNSPVKLKKATRMVLFGVIIMAIGTPLISFIDQQHVIPGMYLFTFSIGSFCVAMVFKKNPMLAFILPFKVNSLTVMDTQSGIALFNYYWNKDEIIDETLFSGMLQGVRLIVKESLGKGEVLEIYMKGGIIILQEGANSRIQSVLVSNRASISLRKALIRFTKIFSEKFSPYFDNPSDISLFDSANELIIKCFSFIPDFN